MFPGAIADLWLSGVHEREKEARAAAATLMAAALDRFVIHSDTSIMHLGIQTVKFPPVEAPAYALLTRWP